MPSRIRELLLAWSIGLPLLALDQWSKSYILEQFYLGMQRPVIDGFFNLVLVKNEGAAWGIFHGFADGLTIFSGIVLALLLAFHTRLFEARPAHRIVFGLILAGIIGNMIDRIRYAAVTDFLDFYIGEHHWPSFNVADSCICVAVGIYMVTTWNPPSSSDSDLSSVLEK